MAKSFQKEKPPSRINLFLEVKDGGEQEKVELPFRMLVTGDYTGKEPDEAVEDREPINIDKDNFEQVLKSMDLSADMVVKDKLTGEGDDDLNVSLKFEDMKSFSPDEVAKQVPELARLLAARNLLQDLRNRLITTKEFRKRLEQVIHDDEARAKLLAELEKVVQSEESEGGESEQESNE